MAQTKFYGCSKNRNTGPFFPKKIAAIQVFTGRKSYHSKPSTEEVDDLEVFIRKVYKKDKKLFKPRRGNGKNGTVSREALIQQLPEKKDEIERCFTLLSDDVFLDDQNMQCIFSEIFFTFSSTRQLFKNLGYTGILWFYTGRDEGLYMDSYYPL